MRSYSPVAYTLVELLVALALSLLLLLGVVELLSRVGGTMNNTRAAMGTSANLHEAAILLRQDLAHIPDSLATKPVRIAKQAEEVSDRDGYLEIIEGPNDVIYVDSSRSNIPDPTVGDVDDIIAFTAFAQHTRFRGLIFVEGENEELKYKIEETEAAEIAWFVRGNTLYRRVRLIKDGTPMSERASRENRLLHTCTPADSDNPDAPDVNKFPFPLYDYQNNPGWRYLRVPTLEETIYTNCNTVGSCTCGKCWASYSQWKTIPVPPNPTATSPPDLWEQPHFFPDLQDSKSGSLKQFVDNPRKSRAGEDVVLTNVLSFDVKVWCPTEGNYVDLGASPTCGASNQSALPRTWDSWTQGYKTMDGKIEPPPYDKRLEAIQITIRCFDPASRVIKQVTVVHRFRD